MTTSFITSESIATSHDRSAAEDSGESPAEIHLGAGYVLARESQHLRVAEAAAVALTALVGHDHLIARLNQPLEVKAGYQRGVRPAALEVRGAVDAGVWRAVEAEVIAEVALEDAALAGHVR